MHWSFTALQFIKAFTHVSHLDIEDVKLAHGCLADHVSFNRLFSIR